MTRPESVPKQRPEREIVLPSGVFAKCRRVTWADLVLVGSHPTNFHAIIIAQQCVRFDGEEWPLQTLMELDVEDAIPILELVMEQIKEATKFIGGVK